MLVPNGEKAFIDPEKLTSYCLDSTHNLGKLKALGLRQWIIETGADFPRLVACFVL